MKKKIGKPQLTISLLASNRPDTIRRCLDSLRPIMDAIPSELILVDTSKNPEIHKILLEYTDQVYEFEWCNDFAKARNVGLKKAKGEWFMFLDDDEWFVDVEELIQFFRSGEYKSYGCVDHRIRNFTDPAYIRYSDCWVTRLYRIEKGCAFHSKVHEYYAPIHGGKKRIYSMSYHSGYVFTSEDMERKHYERNTVLLYDMIEAEPQNLRWKMQLVQEHAGMSEWEKLEEFCKACMDEIEVGGLECTDAHLCCFISGYVHAIGMQERYEEAIEKIDVFMKHPRCIGVLKWQFFYRYTENYFATKQWELAMKYAHQFIEVSKDEEKMEQVVLLQNKILLLGETFDLGRIAKVYAMLIACGLKQGSTSLLCELYDKLQWDKTPYIVANGVLEHFVEAVATLPYEPIFGKLVTDAYRNTMLRPYMSLEAEKHVQDTDIYKNVIYAYAQAESDDEYIWKAKLQVADWANDIDKIVEELKRGYALTEDVFNAHKVIASITDKYSIDLSKYWGIVSPENWKFSVRRYLANSAEEDIQQLSEQIRNVFGTSDWQRRFYEMYLAKYKLQKDEVGSNIEEYVDMTYRFYERYCQQEEAIIDADYEELCSKKSRAREDLLSQDEDMSYEDMESKFYNYMVCVLEYYLTLYKDEAFMGDMEILPPEAKAAVYLNELFTKEEDDFEGRIALLRECAKACKSLGEKVKVFAKLIGQRKKEKQDKDAQSASNELTHMVEVMKVKICQMIELGLKEEAIGILAQVRTLAPADQDLIQMEELCRSE